MKKEAKVYCGRCKTMARCCRLGTWADLEEAKKILELGIKGGDFFHLEKDRRYPSGYRIGTSIEDDPCTFLTPDGLCAIHKLDYSLKPHHCKEFPYEKGKLSSQAKYLCEIVKARHKRNKPKTRCRRGTASRKKKRCIMDFEKLKETVSKIGVNAVRTDEQARFEAVIGNTEIEKLSGELESFFGSPVFPASNTLTRQMRKQVDAFGGIMPGQTLYYASRDKDTVFAMLWPWQDGQNTTVKLIKT